MKFAQKFTAAYIQGKYQYSAWDYLSNNPPISSLRMINYSASPPLKELEAERAAVGFLHFFESLQTTHENTYDASRARTALATLIAAGTDKAQLLGDVINYHYRFDDEV